MRTTTQAKHALDAAPGGRLSRGRSRKERPAQGMSAANRRSGGGRDHKGGRAGARRKRSTTDFALSTTYWFDRSERSRANIISTRGEVPAVRGREKSTGCAGARPLRRVAGPVGELNDELTPRSHTCHHERMMSKHYGDHRAQTAAPAVSLRERPEQALFHISFSMETETVSAALGVLKRAALRLEELATPTQSTLMVERFELPHEPGKQDTAPCSLHLTLTVPLARQASTWERAAQLAQVDDMLRALVQEARKHKPRLDVHRALPVFVVADPEAYRPTW